MIFAEERDMQWGILEQRGRSGYITTLKIQVGWQKLKVEDDHTLSY